MQSIKIAAENGKGGAVYQDSSITMRPELGPKNKAKHGGVYNPSTGEMLAGQIVYPIQ